MTTLARVLTVSFSEPDEYLAELERDVFAVERKIIRVSARAIPRASGTYHLCIVRSGYIVEGRPVLLERLVGTLWGIDDAEVRDRATALMEAITERATVLGLEARPGVLEVVGE